MHESTHVLGIDPGLVHTGLVLLSFFPKTREVVVDSEPVAGTDTVRAQQFLGGYRPGGGGWSPSDAHVFIEKYQPRSHFGTDERMVKAVAAYHQAFRGSTVLLNTGVKKVIRRELMKSLGVWSFTQTTHHQDLRSAAYIALYGMVKDEELNRILARYTEDLVSGRQWRVTQS